MADKKAISSSNKSTAKASSSASNTNSSVSSTYDSVRRILKDMPLIGALVAEFLGAFLLTAAFIEMQGSPLFVAFALGGVVLIIGGVSGAHVNPAVTIGAWVTRKMNWVYALGYIVAQLLGATVAYLVLNTFLHSATTTAVTAAAPTLLHAATIVKDKEWYIFFTELIGTTVLTLGVATALRHKKNRIVAAFAAAFAISLALYVALTLNTTLLQGSTEPNVILTFLNPAIAFAANGLSWNTWPLVIYVVAPFLGGIAGFLIQDFLHSQDKVACDCEDCK